MTNANFVPTFSTDEVYRGQDTTRCLTDDLDTIESDVDGLQTSINGLGNTYAAVNHTHDGYAASNHTHSEYAASDHTHDGYFSADGGTINGNTNIAGILRVNGQQSFYYQTSTQSQTVGTNNATGGTTICCGANADVTMNGINTKTPNAIPKANNYYYCGNSSFRWKGIYSTSAVNVSSDERLKENIEPIDVDDAVNFVNNIDVKSFNYIDDDEPRIGIIAQDVIELSPDLAQVLVDEGEDGYYGVKTSDLVFPLIVAVQELTKQVEELKKQ